MNKKEVNPLLLLLLFPLVVFLETSLFSLENNIFLLRLSLGLILCVAHPPLKKYYTIGFVSLIAGHIISKNSLYGFLFSSSDFMFLTSYYLFSKKYHFNISKPGQSLLYALAVASVSATIASVPLLTVHFFTAASIEQTLHFAIGHLFATCIGVFTITQMMHVFKSAKSLAALQNPFFWITTILGSVILMNFFLVYKHIPEAMPFAGIFLILLSWPAIKKFGSITTISSLLVAYTLVFKSGHSEWSKWLFMATLSLLLILIDDQISQNQQLAQNKSVWADETDKFKKMQTMFLATISHELRTPLTAIMGYTDVLLERNPSLKKELLTMKKNEEFLLSLLNSILDFSKSSLHNRQLQKDKVNLMDIFNEAQKTFLPIAQQKKLDLKFEYQGSFPEMVTIDKIALKEILNNLINNALKFTFHGSVSVGVQFKSVANQSLLSFFIQDTGIGIAESKIKNLFKPFYQVESSMTRNFGGIGLGLAICSNLIRQLGGSITVKSRHRVGTRFDVELPVQVTTPIFVPTQIEQHKEPALPKNKNILIVDDSPDNTDLISLFLQEAHAHVDVAANGKMAVDTIMQKNNYDLVLMDMQMPVMDGYQATKLLRQRGYTLPIIAITAHANTTDKEKCLAVGCTDYVPKPFSKSSLLEKISAILSTSVPLRSH